MRSWVGLAVLVMAAALGCGGDDDAGPPITTGGDDAGQETCVDHDGDGFGTNCSLGRDCDDADPAVTNQCRRCAARILEDCPCTEGTEPTSCTPPVKVVDGGVLVCEEGTRYCRAGRWGGCETIGQYNFVADSP